MQKWHENKTKEQISKVKTRRSKARQEKVESKQKH